MHNSDQCLLGARIARDEIQSQSISPSPRVANVQSCPKVDSALSRIGLNLASPPSSLTLLSGRSMHVFRALARNHTPGSELSWYGFAGIAAHNLKCSEVADGTNRVGVRFAEVQLD